MLLFFVHQRPPTPRLGSNEAHWNACGPACVGLGPVRLSRLEREGLSRGYTRVMTGRVRYEPRYHDSWALIVGINKYQDAGPLDYAVNDAVKIAEAVVELGFPTSNVQVLTDVEATRKNILAHLQLLGNKVGTDDRLFFFFAGHGLTRSGHRGEVGFLVPSDGAVGDLQSLIRWDELTKFAELILAKHVLFIMDACYGGLAVTRSSPGGRRFLKDMLSRFARQVLTAGKADQTVADAGGPRAEHSVFTGHLLDALEGEAANEDGVITANGVMAYVYDRVGRDTDSAQTPHYGCLDGDGDFVFVAPPLAELGDTGGHPQDVLIAGPVGSRGPDLPSNVSELSASLKELLAEPSKRIKLHDLVMGEVEGLLRSTGTGSLPMSSHAVSNEEFIERVQFYEDASRRVICCMSLLGKWCTNENRSILESSIARLADNIEPQGGVPWLLGLRWYPALLAMYCGGIGAIAASDYNNLWAVLTARVGNRRTGESSTPIVVAAIDGILDVQRVNAFKRLPGHENHFVPLSEHLLTLLQPTLEDTLLLGKAYEDRFDQLESLLALVYVDLDPSQAEECWGPPGRFAYKYRRSGRGPFVDMVEEARRGADLWPPLLAGFFEGSADRFKTYAEQYSKFMGRLDWH